MRAQNLIHPAMLTGLSTHAPASFYPSLLTIQTGTEARSPTGAIVTAWANHATYAGLPCRLAPQSATETMTPTQILTQDVQTAAVPAYLAGVTAKHRAIVDGVTWGIVSVDFDGEQKTTRLTLKVVA